MFKVLFLEDSLDMQTAIEQVFKNECIFTFADTNKLARELLTREHFDLVLLDLSLPDGDGFKVCTFIRESEALSELPIIFITGRSEIDDKEMAFSVGADDYLVKPVDRRELRARIMARLNRSKNKESIINVGNISFSLEKQAIYVRESDGSRVTIEATPLELRILGRLARNVDRVFSREQLLGSVWGENIHLFERTVDTHISHIRKKLRHSRASHTIESVHGLGYRFCEKKDPKIRKKSS